MMVFFISKTLRFGLKSAVGIALMAWFISGLLGGEDPFLFKRRQMVERDIVGRGIREERVIQAMLKVPRHLLVRSDLRNQAYADYPLPIEEGQTISQPYVVALMTEALQLKPGDRVLEIGTGSGYQAAVLAEIVKEVYSIEIRKSLAEKASKDLKKLGYNRIRIKNGDGYFGWESAAPFDAIIITAAVNHIPSPLLKQLKDGGRFILPLGSTAYYQVLTLISKKNGDISIRQMGSVRFVPMTGEARKEKQPD